MFFYILSISLQLAGAIILLVFPNSVSRANLIRSFSHNSFTSAKGNSVKYNHEAYVESCKIIYFNRIAFVYLTAGYLGSIFSTSPSEKRYQVFIAVAVILIVLIIIARLVVRLIVTHSKKVTKRITRDELKKLNIEPNIEIATNEDIEKMINDVFKGK